MKALIVTRVSGFVPQFEMNDVHILQEMGYEVHYAANYRTIVYGKDNSRLDGTGIIRHQIDFERLQMPWKLIKTYSEIKDLIRKGNFDLIHVHMPMSAALVRPAAEAVRRETGRKVPVLYTAHGLHFYKGAPLKNWIFYPVEKHLARITDRLILINKEDYLRAKRHFKVRGKVEHIYGIGIDLEKFGGYEKTDWRTGNDISKIHKTGSIEAHADTGNSIGTGHYNGIENDGSTEKNINRPGSRVSGKSPDIRKKYGIPEEDIILISVGELTKRKNNIVMIRAMKDIADMPVTYLICGSGPLENELKKYVRDNGLEDRVKFAGFVENAERILSQADCFVFPSFQEGLPVAVMEAMAVGLPVIATGIRGITDLIENKKGGFLAGGWRPEEYAAAVRHMFESDDRHSTYRLTERRRRMGEWNRRRVKKFGIDSADKKMRDIYKSVYEEYKRDAGKSKGLV